MKIVFISDTHTKHGLIKPEYLPPADVIICSGDISARGYKPEIENFLYWFSKLDQYKHKVFIAGNHDFLFERDPKEAFALVPVGITYLKDDFVVIDGVKIWGSPVSPFFHNWAFNRHRGQEIKKYWDKIPDDVDILVTHTPPYNILDRTVYYEYVGCEDLRKRVFEVKPKIHVFGHIHEAYGEHAEDGILFLNASMLDEDYQCRNKPFLFELDENKEVVYNV